MDTTKHVTASPASSDVNPVATTNHSDSLANFLIQTGRKIDPVKGDGNCLLRALSRQLTGSQDLHLALREMLVTFEANNHKVFSSLLSCTTLDHHLSCVGANHAWGSSIEIAAAASLFQLPIYEATTSMSRDHVSWKWIVFMPYPPGKLKGLNKVDLSQWNVQSRKWLEICYMDGVHYDSVQPTDPTLPTTPPLMTEIHYFCNEIL